MAADGMDSSNYDESPDDLLAAALAAGQTYGEASQALGVSVRTIARRMSEPDFRAKVSELRAAAASACTGRLTDAMASAADTLKALLTDDNKRTRLAAATAIIQLSAQLRNNEELSARIGELEQLLASRQDDQQ